MIKERVLDDMGIFLTYNCGRTNSKNAISKDLVENLEKDLEKLKR